MPGDDLAGLILSHQEQEGGEGLDISSNPEYVVDVACSIILQ